MESVKQNFIEKLKVFATELTGHVTTQLGDWKIKGFIDIDKNIYTISSDTKIISKILEIQLSLSLKHLLRKMVMKSLLLKNKIGILIYLLCARKIQTSSLLDAQIRD
ncbi:type II restriction endonuclease [Helicobacter pylori]